MESYTPKNIWLITDGKPGHETQLIGLGERLQELSGATIHWHHIKSKRLKKGHPSTEFQQAAPQEADPQHNDAAEKNREHHELTRLANCSRTPNPSHTLFSSPKAQSILYGADEA